MTQNELDNYFARIGYCGAADATLETLTALHTGHTFSIPFENLDVFYGRAISLEPDSLYGKLVTRRRGGYCFEMNGLFSRVLTELGFRVTRLLARCTFNGAYTAKTHEVMVVEIGGQAYLCDVGYGADGIAGPLPLVVGAEVAQFTNTYRFSEDPRFGFVLERGAGGGFEPMYAFTLEECLPVDYELSNHYTATHPSSFFRMMKFVTMPTPEGRITLTDNSFKTVADGRVTEAHVSGDAELAELLTRHFGLDFDSIRRGD
ncbi:MAG: arylamine N-acetyltransferase [Oscillospiraceae bacterium]|jgi:N-hydroxyarylamine O-acetyltransferase|nr:arylamine N-acetyltransferase [Oscillospiraceae bacterium]